MKIIGITEIDGQQAMYIKPDSALLVGGKPFFIPHFSEEIVAHTCLVVRVNRLGRCIEERFASRYYDKVAIGLNLQAANLISTPPYSLDSFVRATGFDNSLVVGDWLERDGIEQWIIGTGSREMIYGLTDTVCSIDTAISRVSWYITVRMGDMVAIDFRGTAIPLHKEKEWRGRAGEKQVMYCKIK